MVSSKKTSSRLSLIPEENSQKMPSSSKSTESLYSNSSSSRGSATILYRKNAQGGRHSAFIPATTEVRQRVLSARRLRMKTFQNQLADAQQHIAELAHENRMLRTLHKRQDMALSKYESTNAELPQLLHSHAEEIRIWQAKYRNLQAQNKELLYKLKQKETLVLQLSDQNKHLSQLNKDKNLEERQRLSDKVQQLEQRLQEKETDMKLLARRLQLEAKHSKKELLSEQKKRKEALMQLEKVKLELSGYVKIDELNLNEKLTKLSLGSLTNINNGINEKRKNISQTLLTPLDKKSSEPSSDQSNRSLNTDRSDFFVSTGDTTRKTSGKKLLQRISAHRSDVDEPSELENSSYKTNGVSSENQSHVSVEINEPKVDKNNSYEEDYEDTDNDADEMEQLLGDSKLEKLSKSNNMDFIRKEINQEFKERETFLNTFCRQTTSDSAKLNMNKKTKLLAALKAIEGSSSQD